jgi:competence protein ComFC
MFIFKTAIDGLASVFFAAPCRICSRPLANASRIPICENCLSGFQRIVAPVCHCCGRPFAVAAGAQSIRPLCRLCRAGFYAFDCARSFAVYDDALSEAVLLMKYEEVTRLGHWFANRLAEIVGENAWQADLVIPVPLHHDRRRERGYNQAELIARPLAKLLKMKIEANALVRTRPRPMRLVLSRTEHWKSVRGAYATGTGLNVDSMRILLVDDVLTTGATLDSCSRALKKAGAASVVGLTVGRVEMHSAATGSGKVVDKPSG